MGRIGRAQERQIPLTDSEREKLERIARSVLPLTFGSENKDYFGLGCWGIQYVDRATPRDCESHDLSLAQQRVRSGDRRTLR
jgi:hypothetical protein